MVLNSMLFELQFCTKELENIEGLWQWVEVESQIALLILRKQSPPSALHANSTNHQYLGVPVENAL